MRVSTTSDRSNFIAVESKATATIRQIVKVTSSMTGPQATVLTTCGIGLTLIALKALDIVGKAIEEGATLSFDPSAKAWSLQGSAS